MNLKRCINMACDTPYESEKWHDGWVLESNYFAVLCDKCGKFYNESKYCDQFHSKDSGWRQCDLCSKSLHVGCVASRYLYKFTAGGGVICFVCYVRSTNRAAAPRHDGSGTSLASQVNSTSDSFVGMSVDQMLAYSQQLRAALATHFQLGSSVGQRNVSINLNGREERKPSLPNHASMAPTAALARIPGRNQQLLAHNWPTITDQELQHISGPSNSILVPLFEKVLTASDTSSAGRLVLPKACAETYFPAIQQPEGVPLQMHDVLGNAWNMQYRFWANSNSRMYVLEGAKDCILSLQLKPGDTVTFSRMDPSGRLIIGFRRKSLPPPQSVAQSQNGSSAYPNPQEASTSGVRRREVSALTQAVTPDQAVDQPNAMIEDQASEAYQAPPILGQRSIFTILSNGINEQWRQCVSCSKWRKIPAHMLVHDTWTCVDNIWDESRRACSAPNELTPRELDILVNMKNNEGFNEVKNEISHEEPTVEDDCSRLHALADAAMLCKANADATIVTSNGGNSNEAARGQLDLNYPPSDWEAGI